MNPEVQRKNVLRNAPIGHLDINHDKSKKKHVNRIYDAGVDFAYDEFIFLADQLSWIEQRTSNPQVARSSRARRAR